jgi:superfamily II DNA helicase RecQ
VLAVKEKFKADHIANILAGKVNSAIKSYKHHKLEMFGAGEEKDEKYWNMVIRQAFIAKLLAKDIENYGLLRLPTRECNSLRNHIPLCWPKTTTMPIPRGGKCLRSQNRGSRRRTFQHPQGPPQEDLKIEKRSSICDLSGSFARGYGNPVPGES